jgi:hypothetical protein
MTYFNLKSLILCLCTSHLEETDWAISPLEIGTSFSYVLILINHHSAYTSISVWQIDLKGNSSFQIPCEHIENLDRMVQFNKCLLASTIYQALLKVCQFPHLKIHRHTHTHTHTHTHNL